MLDLSVIIVSYNSSHFLQLCLEALADALQGFDAETIVVDNQSDDDSCQLVKGKYPWVKLIENTSNEGFGKANNKAIAIAQGRHILLLNPDTIIQKATLQQCISILDRDKDNAAVGVKMLDGSGLFLPESKRGLPLPEVAFYKAFGFTRLFPKSKRFSRYYLGHLSDDNEAEVDVLAGAYMMCDASILKASGGFDEDFFMYGEDIDLSYRITQQGYKVFYSPEFPIIHFKGESASRDALWAKRFYEAMHLFSQKHFADQGRLWSQILELGIRVRKIIARRQSVEVEPLDLSDLDLLLVTTLTSIDSWSSFVKSFKSVSIQNVTNPKLTNAQAVLFLPDVARESVIDMMIRYAGKKHFFFATEDFVLTSPNSSSRGEVYFL